GDAACLAEASDAGTGLEPSETSWYASRGELIWSRGSSRHAGSCRTPPQISLSWIVPSRSAIRTRMCYLALRCTRPGGPSGTMATAVTSSRFLSMSAATMSVIASHRATLYTTAHGFGCRDSDAIRHIEQAHATHAATAVMAKSRRVIAPRRSRARPSRDGRTGQWRSLRTGPACAPAILDMKAG